MGEKHLEAIMKLNSSMPAYTSTNLKVKSLPLKLFVLN